VLPKVFLETVLKKNYSWKQLVFIRHQYDVS